MTTNTTRHDTTRHDIKSIRISAGISEIRIDGKGTGLRLVQRRTHTLVHTIHGEYREVALPRRRYLHTVLEPLPRDDGYALPGLLDLALDLLDLGEI